MRGICAAVLLASAGCNLVFELEPVDGFQRSARLEQRFYGATAYEDRPRAWSSARYLVRDDTAATGYRPAPAVVFDGLIGTAEALPESVLEVQFDDLDHPTYYALAAPHLRHAAPVIGRADLEAPPADARVRWQSALTSAWDTNDALQLVSFGVWAEAPLLGLPPVTGATLVDEEFAWDPAQVAQVPDAPFGRLTSDDVVVLARTRAALLGSRVIDTAVASVEQRGGDVIMGPMVEAPARTLTIAPPPRPLVDRVAAVPGFSTATAVTVSTVRAIPQLAQGNRVGLQLGDAGLDLATSITYGDAALGASSTPTFVAVAYAARRTDDDRSTLLTIAEQLAPVAPAATDVPFEVRAPFVVSFLVEGSLLVTDVGVTVPQGAVTVAWTPEATDAPPDLYSVALVEQDAGGALVTRAVVQTDATAVVFPGDVVAPGVYAVQVLAHAGLSGVADGDLTTLRTTRSRALSTSPLFVVSP